MWCVDVSKQAGSCKLENCKKRLHDLYHYARDTIPGIDFINSYKDLMAIGVSLLPFCQLSLSKATYRVIVSTTSDCTKNLQQYHIAGRIRRRKTC